jgi:cytochrome c biogenesis protein CcdA
MANETEWQPITQLLTQWCIRAQYAQYCHFATANYLRKLHYYLGIPSIFLSTLVGTSIFATLEQHDGDYWIRIIAGLVSVLTAGLSTVQTFLRLEERAERHRAAGTQYGKLGRMMEQFYLLYYAGDIQAHHVSRCTKFGTKNESDA